MVNQIPKWFKRQCIRDLIRNPGTTFDGIEVMCVMPKTIWANTLLIYERNLLLDMGDLCEPARDYHGHKLHTALDELALKHPFIVTIDYLELHVWRGHYIEVLGRRKV